FLGSGYQQLPLSDSPDLPIVLGYLLAIVGWLAGLGVFNDPVRQILGRPVGHAETEATTGMARYFRYSLDHKVVGLQYLTAILVGGFHFGRTNYAPGSVQDTPGSDAFAVAFGLMGLSIILAGFNIIVTVICYRAPGMTWGRLPMFVWSMLATSFLMVLAAPV